MGYAARGHSHSGPEYGCNLRTAGIVAGGRCVCLSLRTGVKICTGAHYALLCVQSGCVPGTLLRKVLQIRIPDENAR